MKNLIEILASEGWARLECAKWGLPPNRIHRAWYYVSGYALEIVSHLTQRAADVGRAARISNNVGRAPRG
jgi:hypothetical protein